jgi:XTP/dITP diphosphohydrolase
MTRLVVATTNPHKVREIRGLLAAAPLTLLSLADFPPVPEPDETGATFEENARLKALYYDIPLEVESTRVAAGLATSYTVAEDSGLVIDAMDGEPGVRSARFLRPEATYPERFAEIYRRLDERQPRPWTARFICAVAVVQRGVVVYETTGVVEGEIARQPKGRAGFGYDPIFYYPSFGSTLAEVAEEEKLRVAHRGVAFRALATWLAGTEASPRPTAFGA